MKCGFLYIAPLGEEEHDPSISCNKEAQFTCCDYGGKVCEERKCRCSKPLNQDTNPPDTDKTDTQQLLFEANDRISKLETEVKELKEKLANAKQDIESLRHEADRAYWGVLDM